MADTLTILTTADGRRLAKVVRREGDGWHVEGYEAGVRFLPGSIEVAGLEDIEAALWRLAEDRHSCVIRGELRDHARRLSTVNRCQHVQQDGRQPDWDHARPGRRWVAFDLDKLAVGKPEGRVTADMLAMWAMVARDRLPAPFRRAACVYRLSSSAGLDGWQTVSMHLWFWLSRPVFDLSWRRWAEGKSAIDPALFRSVQPHYTADPVFDGAEDPLRGLRIGRLFDGPETVEVPEDLRDAAGWQAQHEAELAERQAELDAARERIVGGLEQSKSATRKYALQALAGCIQDLLSAPVGGRHASLVTKAYKLGGYVQDGFLSEGDVEAALGQAVAAVFPAARQADEMRTAREMLIAGAAQPLDLSHIGRQAAKPKPTKPPRRQEAPPETPNEVPEPPARQRQTDPPWVHVREDGTPSATPENVRVLLSHHGFSLRHNVMSRSDEWVAEGMVVPADMKRAAILARLRNLARRYGMPSSEQFRDSLIEVQAAAAYHPVADWIRARAWDGIDRFEALFHTLAIREEAWSQMRLFRAMLRAWLVAGARCALLPLDAETGIDSHGVLVLQGPQGCGKTKWLQALVPLETDWMKDGLSVNPADKDDVARATRHWLVELGELDATIRKADIAALKSFLTSQKDSYRRPYGQEVETFARRTFFAASVNPRAFLADDSGNRRFWVLPVDGCAWKPGERPDIDMQQVWAQAAALAQAGEPHVLPRELQAEQAAAVEAHRSVDPWADALEAAFEKLPPTGETYAWTSTSEVYRVLGYEEAKLSHRDKCAIARALSSWGASQVREKRGGTTLRLWSVRPAREPVQRHKPQWYA
jgi:predicted P-loop ATPase